MGKAIKTLCKPKLKNNLSVSITTSDYFDIKNTVAFVSSGGVDSLHFDVMDGVFVPNITYGPDFIASIRGHVKLFFDVHLMILNPLPYIKNFVEAGADMIKVHCEAENCMKSLKLIKSYGVKCGGVINPKTSVSRLKKLLDLVDEITVMSVEPGFGGQTFIEDTFTKLVKISDMIKKSGKKITIQVDGGIDFDIAKALTLYGVRNFVVGSFLFKQKDFKGAVLKFQTL